MAKQSKNVGIEIDAATLRKIGRARGALSELAGAWIMASNETQVSRCKSR